MRIPNLCIFRFRNRRSCHAEADSRIRRQCIRTKFVTRTRRNRRRTHGMLKFDRRPMVNLPVKSFSKILVIRADPTRIEALALQRFSDRCSFPFSMSLESGRPWSRCSIHPCMQTCGDTITLSVLRRVQTARLDAIVSKSVQSYSKSAHLSGMKKCT